MIDHPSKEDLGITLGGRPEKNDPVAGGRSGGRGTSAS